MLTTYKIHAQKIELKIDFRDSIQQHLVSDILYKNFHISTDEATAEIKLFSTKLNRIGFINNTYNTKLNDSIYSCTFDLGAKIDFVRIYYNETLDPAFLKKITTIYNTYYFEIPINDVEKTINLIVGYFEEKGSSFSEVKLIDQKITSNLLTASLSIKQSKERTIDKVLVKGYEDFPNKYYKNYFNLKPTSTFNTKTLKELSAQIKRLSFAHQIKEPEVLFSEDSTIVYLYIKKMSSNKMNGIIGFSNKENSNKLQLTGNIDIELNNIFNKGESLSLIWKNNTNQNKSFKISFFTPYIYNTKFSPSINFSIIKQDSTFTSVKSILKLNYNINKNNSVNTLYRNENSSTISNQTIININDFKKTTFGLSYAYTNGNYKNPLNFEFGYLIGTRKTTETKVNQQNIELFGEYHLILNSKNSILLKQQSEILNSKNVLENELFRIGGASSIRGFDELAIMASKYTVTNLEYHFNLNEESKIYSITDFGYIQNNIINTTSKLYSLGIGYIFNTEKSSTNLSYAVGKNSNTPFSFNNSKIHLKISYFF